MIDDQQMVKLFSQFQSIRRGTASGLANRILRLDYKLANRARAFRTMQFFEMERRYTPQLIEETNRFLVNIHHAECWFKVAQTLDEDDRVSLVWEFAEPHLELSLGRPYSVKNLFVFAVMHLLHQSDALRTTNWKDNLPCDRGINYELLEKYEPGWTQSWKAFPDFMEKIKQLNDKDFEERLSGNFRHKSQHRYRLRFLGLTPVVARTKSDRGITYNFGYIIPLDVEKLILQLYEQHQHAVDVFMAYWQLMVEVCAAWDKKYAQN